METSTQTRVVPIVPGMRTRKRRKNGGSNSGSCNNTVASMNSSTEHNSITNTNDNDSMTGCGEGSITDNDSMRPLADYTRRSSRNHKRQRMTILDAFNSISLKGTTTTNNPMNSNKSSHIDHGIGASSSNKARRDGNNVNDHTNSLLFHGQYSTMNTNRTHHQHPYHTQQQSIQYQQPNGDIQLQYSHDDPNHQQQPYNGDDADSSRAVAEDNSSNHIDGYSTNSSLEDDDEFDDDDDEDDDAHDEVDDLEMLSDKEILKKNVERKVMLELVFGPESTFVPPKDPVDRKFDKLIRNTLNQAVATSTNTTPITTNQQYPNNNNNNSTNPPMYLRPNRVFVMNESQDDISLATTNTSYSYDDLKQKGYRTTSDRMTNVDHTETNLKRSNSLPEIYNTTMDTVTEEMDTTDVA